MINFTIFYMFENPRRGRQVRNFTTNVPKILDLKSSSEQIFFRKLSLGAPDKAQLLHTKRRFPKGVQRNITDFLEASSNDRQHEDLLYHILCSSYCLLHFQNSERGFQNSALRYNFLHAALRLSSFCFKTVICLLLRCTMLHVCY